MLILRQLTVWEAYCFHKDVLALQVVGNLGIRYPDFDWIKMVKLEERCIRENIPMVSVTSFRKWMQTPLDNM